MEYNDEKLNPKIFEKMAQEYNLKLKKNIEFVEKERDNEKKEEIIKNINKYHKNIENNIKILEKYSKNKSQKLSDIFSIYSNTIKNILIENNQKYFYSNYCNNINEIIHNCVSSIDTLLLLDKYQNDFDINCAINYLCKLILQATDMFGICKFRQ